MFLNIIILFINFYHFSVSVYPSAQSSTTLQRVIMYATNVTQAVLHVVAPLFCSASPAPQDIKSTCGRTTMEGRTACTTFALLSASQDTILVRRAGEKPLSGLNVILPLLTTPALIVVIVVVFALIQPLSLLQPLLAVVTTNTLVPCPSLINLLGRALHLCL